MITSNKQQVIGSIPHFKLPENAAELRVFNATIQLIIESVNPPTNSQLFTSNELITSSSISSWQSTVNAIANAATSFAKLITIIIKILFMNISTSGSALRNRFQIYKMSNTARDR